MLYCNDTKELKEHERYDEKPGFSGKTFSS